jgi:hypothetical protein
MWDGTKQLIYSILLVALVSLACASTTQIQIPTSTPTRTVWKIIIDVQVTATPPPPEATKTQHPTATPQPTPTKKTSVTPNQSNNNQQSGYVSLLGRIYSGVKVYYGANKAYGFTILGGTSNCPAAPSGRAVLVEYPDGTREWKDRLYLASSDIYFAKANDPAIDKLEWYEYTGCR